MAVFTTLMTGVKILKKVLDKKKQKEAAKKFVGGGKEEKRAKVKKVMDEEGSYGGKTKAKKPASIDKSKLMKVDIDKVAKVTPDSAKIDYKAFTAKVDNIVGMTDALAFLTGAQSEQKKEELKLLRQQKEEEKKRKKEAKLEKKGDGALGKIGKGVKKTAKGPLDMATNFITKMAIGALIMFLIKNADKIREIFKTIGENLNKFSKLLRVTIFAIQQGIVLAKKGISAAVKGASKLFSPVGEAFKAIGSKISKVFKGLGSKILKMLSKIPGLGFLRNLAAGATRGVDTAKTVLTAKKEVLKKTFNKVTGGILKKGLAKAPSRLILKLFGKDAAKMVAKSGKLFKVLGKAAKGIKIPVLGPIIVAVTSILSGDPLGKTLFKTLGAVFGGMIGGAIGAALGGVGAPFGLLLGEIVGEFIGSFLYDMFNGDEDGTKGVDFLKKKFGQLLTGTGKAAKSLMNFALSMLTKAGNFFKDGFTRFVEDFPTVKVPKGGGLQSALGLAAGALGLDDKSKFIEKGKSFGKTINLVTSLPNLALLTPFGMPFLLPHLKNSFFPTGEQGSGGITGETTVAGSQETGLEETGTKYAVKYYDEDGNEIDALSEEAENLKKDSVNMLKGEEISSNESASSNVSAVSTHASYEGSEAGTVVLTKPQRSDFGGGRSGASKYQQAMIMYNNQKEMLNSYQKTQVKLSLAKI